MYLPALQGSSGEKNEETRLEALYDTEESQGRLLGGWGADLPGHSILVNPTLLIIFKDKKNFCFFVQIAQSCKASHWVRGQNYVSGRSPQAKRTQ